MIRIIRRIFWIGFSAFVLGGLAGYYAALAIPFAMGTWQHGFDAHYWLTELRETSSMQRQEFHQ